MRCHGPPSLVCSGDPSIQALLFERPLLLVPALAVIQLVLIGVWSNRRTDLSRRIMVAGFLVFALLVVVQKLVVTDRERIEEHCHALARAVQRGDVPAVGRLVADDFLSEQGGNRSPWNKKRFLDLLQQLLTRYDIEEADLKNVQVEVEGDRGVARFAAVCRVVTPEAIEYPPLSTWEVTFGRRDSLWRVVEIRLRPTPLFPFRYLADIPR